MNTNNFKPDSVALVVSDEVETAKNYTPNGTVNLIEHNPNYIEFDLQTESDQFLVVAEIYYPEGWIAKLDETEVNIKQVNHVLRGVEVSSGRHKLTFAFKPATYYASLTYLWIGNIIILGLIIIPFVMNFAKRKK